MEWKTISNFIIQTATSLGIKLLEAIIILIVGIKLIKWVKKFIKTSPKLDKLDVGIRSFLCSFSGILLYALLFITIAMILGVPVTSFITILASCGVAVGLALQGSLSNFAGGIMILLFKPFKVGDYIEAAGEAGVVSEINVVYTVLLTPDNKRITVPNGSLTNSVIENYSSEKLRRVDLTFNTAYNCDIDKVEAVIADVVSAKPQILKDPEPFIRLSKQLDSSLEYTVRVWCDSADYWNVYFDIMTDVKKAFDANGIEIPYPQLDVHINN